jgi:uncharacterized protein (TIGR02266 family)
MIPTEERDTTAGTNRRAYKRYDLELPVRFRSEMLDFRTKARFTDASVSDISCGGLFIKCDFFEVPGTPVRLLLTVPTTLETLHLEGHVAWIVEEPPKGPGMGVRISKKPLREDLLQRFLVPRFQ